MLISMSAWASQGCQPEICIKIPIKTITLSRVEWKYEYTSTLFYFPHNEYILFYNKTIKNVTNLCHISLEMARDL